MNILLAYFVKGFHYKDEHVGTQTGGHFVPSLRRMKVEEYSGKEWVSLESLDYCQDGGSGVTPPDWEVLKGGRRERCPIEYFAH